MKTIANFVVLFVIASASVAAAAQDRVLGLDVLATTAYRSNPDRAAEADVKFARAMELFDAKLTKETVREYGRNLDEAAILGHEGAAEFLCAFNSNENLGTAFFRQAYTWCRIAKSYLAGKDPVKVKQIEKNLAYATKRLGRSERYLGEDHEQYTLKRMVDAANAPSKADDPS